MNPKSYQRIISDVITLGSLYYKLEFVLTHHQPTGQFCEAALNLCHRDKGLSFLQLHMQQRMTQSPVIGRRDTWSYEGQFQNGDGLASQYQYSDCAQEGKMSLLKISALSPVQLHPYNPFPVGLKLMTPDRSHDKQEVLGTFLTG